MPKRKRHAEIAGAGLAGLTLAAALGQRGWTVRVHEMDKELRTVGAGIFIWENGLRVLKAIGAYERAVDGAHEAPGYESRDNRNTRLCNEAFGPERGTRMLTMTRQQLYKALFEAAEREGADFVTNSQIVAADPAGTLTAADGRSYRADLVVGADGVRSKVRESLGLLKERTKFDQGVIRLLVSRDAGDAALGDADNVINFWSPNHRILYVPCNPADLYLLFAAHVNDREATRIPLQKETWISIFPFLEPIIRRIGNQGRYDVYEVIKLETWSRGRVAVLGDAAHGMCPTLGQGAGCAMMNALGLAVALDETDDVPEALRIWEERERPLTEHTQEISSLYVRTRAGSNGVSKWDDAALRAARHIPTGTT